MYAPQWTTAEAGCLPSRPLAGPAGSAATPIPALHDPTPGAAVRHVLRAIASERASALERRQALSRVRALVNREHAALRARFEEGGSVDALMRGLTRLADGAVLGLLHLARAVTASEVLTMIAPLTVLAVGGYGRRELAPASDLDLLFVVLERSEEGASAERLIGFVLTGLWDLGFTVGHATRTAAECRALADADPVVLASLLDAISSPGPTVAMPPWCPASEQPSRHEPTPGRVRSPVSCSRPRPAPGAIVTSPTSSAVGVGCVTSSACSGSRCWPWPGHGRTRRAGHSAPSRSCRPPCCRRDISSGGCVATCTCSPVGHRIGSWPTCSRWSRSAWGSRTARSAARPG